MRNIQRLLLPGLVAATLSITTATSQAQPNEQKSRDDIRRLVRLQLHLAPDHFLIVQRDEQLEQRLTLERGKGGVFLYRVSQAGDEIKGNAVVHHIFTDTDPTYIVAVNADGSMYRVHGFSDSGQEFERLLTAVMAKISSPEDAELAADFYREVNPTNQPLTRISGLLDLKQAAERQCQTVNFDDGERAFDAWWSRAKSLYTAAQFKEAVARSEDGYIVQWIVLSSPSPGMCAGVPVQARLYVGSDGHIRFLGFKPAESPRAGR